MGEVVGQLGVQITPLTGVYPIWQEFCNQSEEEGVTPQWTVIHWLDPPRMVNSIFTFIWIILGILINCVEYQDVLLTYYATGSILGAIEEGSRWM